MLSTLLSTEPSSIDNLGASLQLEKKIAEKRLEGEEAITTHNQIMNRPHMLYAPEVTHDSMQWVVKMEFSEGAMLVGRGDSVNDALIDFDKKWLGVE